jgi:hypothetical protein
MGAARFPLCQECNPMKTLLQDRNTARPLGGSAVLREILGSVLPGSAIAPVSSGRFRPRLNATVIRGVAIRLC